MIILMTGDVNVGKSYIIKAITDHFENEYDGFETLPFYGKEKREGFYMKSISTSTLPSKENIIAIMDNHFKPLIFETVFETLGVHFCKKLFLSKKKIIIVDEIGVFEKNCEQFKLALLNLLTLDKIIVLVLKNTSYEFLDKISENRTIYHITSTNRTEQKILILSEIEKCLKK